MSSLIIIIKKIAKSIFSFSLPPFSPSPNPPFFHPPLLPVTHSPALPFSPSPLRPLFLIIFLIACENDIEKVNLVTQRSNAPTETGKGLEILYSDSAQIKVKIITPELNRYLMPTPQTELPKGVHIDFFDDNMKVTSTLTSKYALRKEGKKIMEAKKDVVIVNSKGEKLFTEHLTWDEKTGKIYSEEFVKIVTADEIIMGNGFESNQDFTRYKIFDITGTINISKNANVKNP